MIPSVVQEALVVQVIRLVAVLVDSVIPSVVQEALVVQVIRLVAVLVDLVIPLVAQGDRLV